MLTQGVLRKLVTAGLMSLAPSLSIFAAEAKVEPELLYAADVRIPTRDGLTLSARIWRPESSQPVPVIMQHTPYLSDETHLRAKKFVAANFIYVSLDRRGRGTSDGVYWPLEHTGNDGVDAAQWLAKQPWSDGRVAMMGGSYRGMTQWQALASNPTAIAAAIPTASVYPGWDYPQPRGIFLSYMTQWLAFTDGRASNIQLFGDQSYWTGKALRAYRGEIRFDQLAQISGAPEERFQRWLAHPSYDQYWKSLNPRAEQYRQINTPILTITGYFDGDQEGSLRYFREHEAFASAEARAKHWMLIGPYDHAGTRYPAAEVDGLAIGAAAKIDMDALQIAWFEHILRGGPRPELTPGRINYYVMGAEEWRSAPSLDAIAQQTWSLYLRGEPSRTMSVLESGALLAKPGKPQAPSSYRFDPRAHQPEPVDSATQQRRLVSHATALRANQLVFHSEPLSQTRTLCGEMTLDAHIAINVPDTDIKAEVYEWKANNEVRWLGRDYLRARFRASFETETLQKPGKIEPWHFGRFWFTCRQLDAGSRIRLVVAPLDDAGLQPNWHTGGKIGFEDPTKARVAEVKLYHDQSHPSVLRLPLIEPR